MMFAEMSSYDPPILIPVILGSLMFLLIGANAAAEFLRNVKDKPTGQQVMDKARKEFQPKGDYQPAGDYITRQEWNAREQTLQIQLSKLSTENKSIMDAGAEREKHIVDRIDNLQDEIASTFSTVVTNLLNAKNLFGGERK